jgi:prepilin-type N-terminal cleavage/methylation domain-containing protein
MSRRTVVAAQGFTLIELLVVISIIALMSAVILASLNAARNKSFDAARQSNLIQVRQALESYYSDHGSYPPPANGLYTKSNSSGLYSVNSECQIGNSLPLSTVIPGLVPTYIAALPSDSQMVAGSNVCCYEYFVSQNNQNYKYMFFGCPTSLAGLGTNGLNDPAGTNHHPGAWSVYSGTGTLF